MIILPKTIENKKVILDSIKTEIKSINNDINSQNDIKRKIVSYFRDFVYHIDFLQLDYISDSLKNIVSYLDISDATLDIYEALLAQVYDIKVQVKKNSDIDKYKKLVDIYNKKYEEQSKIITSNVNKINSLFSTSFSEIHTDTENLENTLVIDEINSQVILPYNLKDVYNLLKHDTTYNTINDAINAIYRKPLSHYKNAPIARFREAYNLIKEREHGSTKEAVDLGLELMFNGKLHPAIITSCKTLDQLDIYLSCLEYNELNDFHFFKVLYKALPETKKKKGFLRSKFSGQLQKVLEQSKQLINNKIPSRNDIFSSVEKTFDNKLEEIKQKHETALESVPEETAQDVKFTITGYKTLFFGEEVVDEVPLFTITGYKTISLQQTKVTEPEQQISSVETEKQQQTIEVEDNSKQIIDDLIDSIQDNYNGTRHTRVEKDLMEVVEENKKAQKKSSKRTIVRATTIRTSDNAEKDRKAEEARRASLRVITGARTFNLPKENLFTITGYKTIQLEKKVPPFTITGYKTIQLEKKIPPFTITGYKTIQLEKKIPPFTITGYKTIQLKKKIPPFTITGYKTIQLEKKVPPFTITGYRIFRLQAPLLKITGYRTMHFGIGDIDALPEETNIEEALQSISEQTNEPLYNQVADVIGKLKQIQANSKYYYVPPTQLEEQPEELVDNSKEESTEEIAETEHDKFSDRFNISVINTTLKDDPLLSAIESLDDFDEEDSTHNSYSDNDSDEDEIQSNKKAQVEIPLVKSIKRSRKKVRINQ